MMPRKTSWIVGTICLVLFAFLSGTCHEDDYDMEEIMHSREHVHAEFMQFEGTKKMAAFLQRQEMLAPPDDWTISKVHFSPKRQSLSEFVIEDITFAMGNYPENIERYKHELREAIEDNSSEESVTYKRLGLGKELLLSGRTEEALDIFQQLCFQNSFYRSSTCISPRADSSWDRFLRDLIITAYLRMAYQNNCKTELIDSRCLFPVGEYNEREFRANSMAAIAAARMIIDELERENRKPNKDILTIHEYTWLLNLAYLFAGECVLEEYLIHPSVFLSEYEVPKFVNVARGLQVDAYGTMGGSIMDDFDNNGLLDIVVSSQGLHDPLYVYKNLEGLFIDVHKETGLSGIVGGMNLKHADYNNDGYLDIFVVRGGGFGDFLQLPNSLLKNNGNGTFEDVTQRAGLLSFFASTTATWGDYDLDGHLDLFVPSQNGCSELFHNNGDGTFTNVADKFELCAAGAISASWSDFNNDRFPDLYISFIEAQGKLYKNEGRAHPGDSKNWLFTDVTEKAGVGMPIEGGGSAWFDVNHDGWLDLLVVAFTDVSIGGVGSYYSGISNNTSVPFMYVNNQDGTFRMASKEMKIKPIMNVLSFNFGDLDNDGFVDLYFGTGSPDLRSFQPNVMLRNNNGMYFEDVTTSGGFGYLQKSQGISWGDIDNDGDQDIYVEIGGIFTGDADFAALFLNPAFPTHSWITITLVGSLSNRAAIGTRVKMVTLIETDLTTQQQVFHHEISTGSTHGSNSLRLEAGLGKATQLFTLEIFWPASKTTQIFHDVPLNNFIEIIEGDTTFNILTTTSITYNVPVLLGLEPRKTTCNPPCFSS